MLLNFSAHVMPDGFILRHDGQGVLDQRVPLVEGELAFAKVVGHADKELHGLQFLQCLLARGVAQPVERFDALSEHGAQFLQHRQAAVCPGLPHLP